MSKKKNSMENQIVYQHHRGTIQESAVKALLQDPLFRQRIEKKRKGKGSYQRKPKYAVHYGEKPDYQSFRLEF